MKKLILVTLSVIALCTAINCTVVSAKSDASTFSANRTYILKDYNEWKEEYRDIVYKRKCQNDRIKNFFIDKYGLTFKYYNREEENPFSRNDIRNHFWHGEMMFVITHQNSGLWKNEGKEWLKTANEQIKQLANKYTPEQFGLITYIAFQYSKWYPSDDPIWIVEY